MDNTCTLDWFSKGVLVICSPFLWLLISEQRGMIKPDKMLQALHWDIFVENNKIDFSKKCNIPMVMSHFVMCYPNEWQMRDDFLLFSMWIFYVSLNKNKA